MTRIGAKTQLLGLIGWPVSHSYSPAMHNAAIEALDLDYVYLPLPVAPGQVGDAVRGLPALGFRGANVTVPYKRDVMPFLDEITPAAAVIGAVNTILVETDQDGRLSGDNTDWQGFLADLRRLGVLIGGRDCLVLGAGGSARAVVYALHKEGAQVRLLARRLSQAQDLVHELGFGQEIQTHALSELPNVAADMEAPLIVNTTPLGMSPAVEASIWPNELPMPRGSFAYDLVYNPPQTRFVRQAADSGCGASSGLGMLLGQGVASLALWTGKQPDQEVMLRALKKAAGLA